MRSLAGGDSLTAGAAYVSILRMSLLRGLFWLVLFVFFAFCFVVLFEHGTSNFAEGFQTEFKKVKTYVVDFNKPAKKDDKK